jgi:poly-gamma-glutamate capsule biosynthesis protein CapA/YwtB (metallophosphatase superfamily)
MTSKERSSSMLELLLGGDVMTGRGVDQILPHPSGPEIFEDYIHDARGYVELAEARNGPVPRPVAFDYVWGEALPTLEQADVRIVNLETSVTRSDAPWPYKGINYRMHPENVACLSSAKLDVVGLANNHVLDWGVPGLLETVDTLHAAGLRTAGAGATLEEAEAVAVVELVGGRRVLVVAAAEPGSGVPFSWAAGPDRPGVAFLSRLDDAEADAMARRVDRERRGGDVVVASIHWGSNWGYEVEPDHVWFAHALVERGIDVVFGHSSHHPRPIEIHRGKPILYGSGDLLNDYEGIRGYEPYRNDLVLAYSIRITGGAFDLRMKPFRLHKMRLELASAADVAWLADTLAACSGPHGTEILRLEAGWLRACSRRDAA